jgi:soluble lytic murein transglycosylase-like protein
LKVSPRAEKFLDRCSLALEDFEVILAETPCPWHLVLGVIFTESAGRPGALRFEPDYAYLFNPAKFSEANLWTAKTEEALQKFSYGLMQIMLAVARERGFEGHPSLLLVPRTNVAIGVKYLTELYSRHGNWRDAVSAYNAGRPAKLGGGAYRNQAYVDSVFAAAKLFAEDGDVAS